MKKKLKYQKLKARMKDPVVAFCMTYSDTIGSFVTSESAKNGCDKVGILLNDNKIYFAAVDNGVFSVEIFVERKDLEKAEKIIQNHK